MRDDLRWPLITSPPSPVPSSGAFPVGVPLKKLLIKSQPFFVHRRTQQATVDSILRLKTKIVPTVQK